MTNLKRVLILEENTDHLELLVSLLEEHFTPIDIHTVETVEDCLDFMEQTDYDLIMTGCYIHKICITERFAHISDRAHGAPIIVISGSGDENIAAELIKLGASDYLVKNRKTIEKIPELVAKYFKRGRKGVQQKKSTVEEFESTGRVLRELDHLMQKARALTSSLAIKAIPEDTKSIESLFSQIQRLRKIVQERK